MARSRLTSAVAVTVTLILAGCHARSSPPEVPAIITSPTAESRAELHRVVSGALNGAPITIAADALTGDSTLIIERNPPRDSRGLPLDGRQRGRPERFQLVKNGPRCLLIHERTGRRWPLSSVTCSPR